MKTGYKILSMALLLALMLASLPVGASPAMAAGCYWAQFIADVTVPDGANFAPNTAFKKTWRIKNIGSCTWNSSDTSLIFDSGERMNAPASLSLPSTVAPGQTVDITVDLTAPNAAGHYFGYWKFKSNTGEVFGIGSNANRSFWVEINVPSSTTAGYDFTANASSAAWSSGAGYLSFPGDTGSLNGFGIKQDAPVMENGIYSSKPGLLFSPQNIFNGYVQAVYPAFRVQSGDRFQATIGCEYGARNCYVSYGLYYQIGSGPIKTFWTFREKYEGLTYNVNLDLTSLANQDVKFILAVSAYGPSSGDRAVWVNPIISRIAPPPPPSATLPDLLFSNIYLGIHGIPGSPATCIPNYGMFEIRVTVLNKGLTAAYNIPVVEATTNTQLTIGQLLPGQSMELYFPAGGAAYNFVIDPQNTIQETDKNNNKSSYIPITPTPPVVCTPVVTSTPSPTPTPVAQTVPLIVWQSASTPCKTASFWSDHMVFGECASSSAALTTVYYASLPDYYNLYTSRHDIWSKAYAPFTAQTRVGTVTFNGSGYVTATPAEQRMMAEWAIIMFSELPESSTSGITMPITANYSGNNSCYSLAIYRDGRYHVDSCLSGYTYPAPNGYLGANELMYLYRWMDLLQIFQIPSDSGTISFAGDGPAPYNFSQQFSIEMFVLSVESRAKGKMYASGGGMPTPVFVAQLVLAQQLGISISEIQVKNIEPANFPDACLDAYEYYCEQVPVAGYKIQLIAQGMLYQFNSDSAGYDIRQIGGPQPVSQGGG